MCFRIWRCAESRNITARCEVEAPASFEFSMLQYQAALLVILESAKIVGLEPPRAQLINSTDDAASLVSRGIAEDIQEVAKKMLMKDHAVKTTVEQSSRIPPRSWCKGRVAERMHCSPHDCVGLPYCGSDRNQEPLRQDFHEITGRHALE